MALQILNESIWKTTGAHFPLDGRYLINATLRRTQTDDLRVAFLAAVENGITTSITPTTALQVRLITDPSPPISGTVGLSVTLLDGEGNTIDNALFSVVASRPASQEAPVAGELTAVEGTPGLYAGSIELPATGPWLLVFSVVRDSLPDTENRYKY